jgi:hypothetical protein
MAEGMILVIAIAFILLFSVISIAVGVATIIGEWKVFEKAGKPGWIALIPFYNNWTLFEISGVNPLFTLFSVGVLILNMFGSLFNIMGNSEELFYAISILLSLGSFALSIVFMVFSVMAALNLAKCFGKSSAYGIGLFFIPIVFYLMLGFDKNANYTPIKK